MIHEFPNGEDAGRFDALWSKKGAKASWVENKPH